MRYLRILETVSGQLWAIRPEKGQSIIDFLSAKAQGLVSSMDDIANAKSQASDKPNEPYQRQKIAVLPISSVIMPRAHDITDSSLGPGGAQSSEYIGKVFDRMVASSEVSAIILDIDSPGGAVAGISELFDKIYNARQVKPIIAISNHCCASAAFWVGCAASEFVMSPSAMVGSVGVYTYHDNISELLAKKGVKRTYISSSPEKVERASEDELSQDARDYIQAMVDTEMSHFVRDISRGRNLSEIDVRKNFGKGRMYKSEAALSYGMVDRVATLENLISELSEKITKTQHNVAYQKYRFSFA